MKYDRELVKQAIIKKAFLGGLGQAFSSMTSNPIMAGMMGPLGMAGYLSQGNNAQRMGGALQQAGQNPLLQAVSPVGAGLASLLGRNQTTRPLNPNRAGQTSSSVHMQQPKTNPALLPPGQTT